MHPLRIDDDEQLADVFHRCNELIGLLHLSEIVLAEPEPAVGLQAIVDELVRMPRVASAIVMLQQDGELRVCAHRNVPGQRAHRPFAYPRAALACRAMAESAVLTAPAASSAPHRTCIYLPILGGDQGLGVLAVGLAPPLPLSAWLEEVMATAVDYVAMVVLGQPRRARAAGDPPEAGGAATLPPVTARQRDVLFALVDHDAGNRAIAERLGLSERTVKIHLAGLYRALGVQRRGEVIRLVLTQHQGWLAQERVRRSQGILQAAACDPPPPDESDHAGES